MQYQKPEAACLGEAKELILGGKTFGHLDGGGTNPFTFRGPDNELDD